MAFRDFKLEDVEERLGFSIKPAGLFHGLSPVEPPQWLRENLRRGARMPLLTEKARSELLVTPILMAVVEMANEPITLFSGIWFDVDTNQGLHGECDFLVSRGEPLPMVRPPVLVMVEAKKQDIDVGFGQCMAQMFAGQIFNERKHIQMPVYGCITTGESWQFLKLDGKTLMIDPVRIPLNQLEELLAILLFIVQTKPTL
jgi:hypothetical protein